jgi:hypothetical protein
MTIEYNPNTKNNYVAISIKDSSVSNPPNSKLFCNLCNNLCNCKLVLFDAQKKNGIVTDVTSVISQTKERVKRPNKFETPGPTIDKHGNITGEKRPIVSMIDNTPNLSPKK